MSTRLEQIGELLLEEIHQDLRQNHYILKE